MSFLTPALGFASNLSHTIIRETQEDDERSEHSDESVDTTISITDEELALLGPPWAKEGMLCRKQYNESSGKRAKSKAWLDVFVVIQKGELNMFTFGEHAAGGQRVVGGGNWLVRVFHLCRHEARVRLTRVCRKMPTTSACCNLPTPWRTLYLHRAITDSAHIAWF